MRPTALLAMLSHSTRTTSTRTTATRTLALGTGALALIATLAGCQPDRGPGSVLVTYRLGNSKTCDEVEVASIRATVFRGGTIDAADLLYSEEVDCEDGEVLIENVNPNTYELVVVGYDNAGVAIFDNLGQPVADRKVEVFDAADSETDADLTARPAELLVRWRLGDGGFDNCAGIGIDRFEIQAYQIGGGTVLLETEIDCEVGGGPQGFRTVEDPDRQLNGAQFGEVGVQAVAPDGSDVGSPAVYVFDPVGPGYAVELTIECTAAGCLTANP
jgi:hypothetical protein